MSLEHGVFRAMPPQELGPRSPSRPRIEERLARRGGWVEVLRAPAMLYRLATGLRNRAYDHGWLRPQRVDVPVISVGNLTAGGTGKTPFAVWLARHLVARGRRPGVLSRGYGARTASEPEGRARGQSDEAALIVRALPDVPHLAQPDRVRGARELERRGLDVVILDDGFQHRRLARDLDFVLVDATRPWGFVPDAQGRAVRALLPRGLLRESLSGLARADAVVLTRTDQCSRETLDRLRGDIGELAPGLVVVETRHRCVAVREHVPAGSSWAEGWLLSPDALADREVDLVSGIGHPAAFEATVAGIGARIATHRVFPDHHAFQASDLVGLGTGEGGGGGGRALVTTSKDAVKLERFGRPFWTVEVEIEVLSGGPVLEALLEALPEGRAVRERRALHEGLHG